MRECRAPRLHRGLVLVLTVLLLTSGAACRGESPATPKQESPVADAPGPADSALLDPALRDLLQRGSSFEFVANIEDPRSGPQVLSGTGTLSDGRVSMQIDGTEAPNAAGFWGHHDRFDAAFDGTSAYFQVIPANNWLLVTLDAGGSLAGKDIARLRDLVVVNPLLIINLIEGHEDGAVVGDDGTTFSLSLDTRGDVSEEAKLLRRAYGVDEFEVRVNVDEAGKVIALGIDLVYELVRDSTAVVDVEGIFELSGSARKVAMPPDESITRL